MKELIPLLIKSQHEKGIITPKEYLKQTGVNVKLPKKGILTFSYYPHLVKAIEERSIEEYSYDEEVVRIVIVKSRRSLIPCVIVRGIGAPLAAMTLEEIRVLGMKRIILLGGAGVLTEIPFNTLIIPTEAIRDEGTSYHYLTHNFWARPSRDLSEKLVKACREHKVQCTTGKTWTTDAFYRETPSKRERFMKAGAICVEMEAAACFAVATYRSIKLAALFFQIDSLSQRLWHKKAQRSKEDFQIILQIAIDALK